MENTEAINRLLREGNAEVVHLDAIMHNKYTRNSDKLRAWLSASHVERAPVRDKKATGQDRTGTGVVESSSKIVPETLRL